MNRISIWDIAEEVMTRLTFGAGETNPVWTPDGKRLAFASRRVPGRTVDWKLADGAGQSEPVTESDLPKIPISFTPDGAQLLFIGWDGQKNDIGAVSLDGSSEWVMDLPLGQHTAAISPDGAWIAYHTYESGRRNVYVRPFPNFDDGRWLVSRDGGNKPAWSPDGSELYYLSPSREMIAVPVRTEPTFSSGNPSVLFRGDYYTGRPSRNYECPSLDTCQRLAEDVMSFGFKTRMLLGA